MSTLQRPRFLKKSIKLLMYNISSSNRDLTIQLLFNLYKKNRFSDSNCGLIKCFVFIFSLQHHFSMSFHLILKFFIHGSVIVFI